jgi:hypothetical protein
MFVLRAALVATFWGVAVGTASIETMSDGSLLLSSDLGGTVMVNQGGATQTVATTSDVSAQTSQLTAAISRASSTSAVLLTQSLAQASTSVAAAISQASSTSAGLLTQSLAQASTSVAAAISTEVAAISALAVSFNTSIANVSPRSHSAYATPPSTSMRGTRAPCASRQCCHAGFRSIEPCDSHRCVFQVTGQVLTGQQYLSGRVDSADLGLVAAATGRLGLTTSIAATTYVSLPTNSFWDSIPCRAQQSRAMPELIHVGL